MLRTQRESERRKKPSSKIGGNFYKNLKSLAVPTRIEPAPPTERGLAKLLDIATCYRNFPKSSARNVSQYNLKLPDIRAKPIFDSAPF